MISIEKRDHGPTISEIVQTSLHGQTGDGAELMGK
jgi:hypothetical protein